MIPEFNNLGDLPQGIHHATLEEIQNHFGSGSSRRMMLAKRLERILELAQSTSKLKRVLIWGSFVTAKAEPGDVEPGEYRGRRRFTGGSARVYAGV